MHKVNSNNAGKGSKPRPISISKEQYKKNWDKIFNKEKQNATSRKT